MITPNKNCSLCPRLKQYRDKYKIIKPEWHNSPVESFGNLDSMNPDCWPCSRIERC